MHTNAKCRLIKIVAPAAVIILSLFGSVSGKEPRSTSVPPPSEPWNKEIKGDVEEAIRLSAADPISSLLTFKSVMDRGKDGPTQTQRKWLSEKLENLRVPTLKTLQIDFDQAVKDHDLRTALIASIVADKIGKNSLITEPAITKLKNTVFVGSPDLPSFWAVSNAAGKPTEAVYKEEGSFTLRPKEGFRLWRVTASVRNTSRVDDRSYTLWAIENVKRVMALQEEKSAAHKSPYLWLDGSFIFLLTPASDIVPCSHVCNGCGLHGTMSFTVSDKDGNGRALTVPQVIESGKEVDIDLLFSVPNEITECRLLILGSPPVTLKTGPAAKSSASSPESKSPLVGHWRSFELGGKIMEKEAKEVIQEVDYDFRSDGHFSALSFMAGGEKAEMGGQYSVGATNLNLTVDGLGLEIVLYSLKDGVLTIRDPRFDTYVSYRKCGDTKAPEIPQVTQEPKKTLTVDLGDGVIMEFVLIRPGSFTMGSDKVNQEDENPAHKVTLTTPFYLGKYEVTQEQWEIIMGNNPSRFKGAKNPVEQVSWNDCQNFLVKLQEKVTDRTFRLPTEAEWEYACRAGSTGNYAGNLDEMSWYDSNSGGETHAVATKKANAWGLFDMHGNVWEWCADRYGDYPVGAATDPTGPNNGSDRVFRGGSWGRDGSSCRSAARNGNSPGLRVTGIGFRLAAVPAGH